MASFFLIQVDPGHADALAQLLTQMPGVYDASVTSGPYDVIAEVTPGVEHLQRISTEVRRAPGLAKLWVCQGSTRRPVMS